MSANWVLLLQAPQGDPCRKVGGLSLVLRLALDAQSAGAMGIVDQTGDPRVAAQLADRRLRVPVEKQTPTGALVIAMPCHFVMHRSTFATVLSSAPQPATRLDLDPMQLNCLAPWGFEPMAVTDTRSAKVAERRLFRSLRKVQDGWTSRWLNRYISLAISRWLVKTPFSPNQISIGILAIGLFGAYLASRGSYTSLALGAILFQMQSVLDGCDGEISRITYRGSKMGEWFDTVGDDLTNYSFFACAGCGLFYTQQQSLYLIASAIVVLGGVISSGLEYRYLIRIGSGDLLKYPLSQATTGPSRGIARLAPLLKRDTFVFLTMLAALANQVGIALIVFAVGAIAITTAVIRTEIRLARSSPEVR
jgi:phosphatidylglycerophosphate synthase